jgi:hypothetical protein
MYSKEGIQRITRDTDYATKKFPQFKLYRAGNEVLINGWKVARSGMYYLAGKLTTRSKNVYTVAISFPENFPFGDINSFVVDPVIYSTEHRYSDGHLCLYGHNGKGDIQVQGQTSAASIIAWTAAWLHAYEIWKKNNQWPMLNL